MTRTTCPYCGVGCGVVASGVRDQTLIEGDRAHRANVGALCSKGASLGETVGLEGRLLHPTIGGTRARWDAAINLVARRFSDAIEHYGPDSVAFYVSGQLLTEDYYAANKLMKGFIGSGNIDTNSRLCMASAVAAHKLAFGEDVVPAIYEDLTLAEVVVFSGHNAAWTHPVLFRRMESARAQGQRHIVIDPRETETTRGAWLHLKLRAQTDVRLWNGLLCFLEQAGAVDRGYIQRHTEGFDAVLDALHQHDQSIPAIAADCGLSADDVRSFYAAFADTPRTVTLFSQGSNQAADGVAKGLGVLNAHLATGRVSQPGASPFSITGQPNAMGGRETGGLANMLASHMEFTPDDIERVQRFWDAPRVAPKPGLKAVELFDAVADGRIRAVWIMATNPVVSMPNADHVRKALAGCPFVVVSEVIADTDTTRMADVLLPALAWGEKDGTVTNSERCISRQRPHFAPPGEARADWRIVSDVARAMGWGRAFAFEKPAALFREYAAMTGFENEGRRVLDLGMWRDISDSAYDALEPTIWPPRGASRPFERGRFATASGRARFVTPVAAERSCAADRPFTLNTGRIRDQWHTMTRTGLSPRLMKHAPDPFVQIHPKDAARHAIVEGELVVVRGAGSETVLTATLTSSVREGEIFAPMHWGATFAPHARVNAVVAPLVDPVSGQPEFKSASVSIARAQIAWRAFYVTSTRRDPPNSLWWRRIVREEGYLYEIAAGVSAPEFSSVAQDLQFDDDAIVLRDQSGSFLRSARLEEGRLVAAFFATRGKGLPPRDWLVSQLGALIDLETRALILSGGPHGAARAPCVCACFDVDRASIEAFYAANPEAALADVAVHLKAGGNCGSCRPEIAAIGEQVKRSASHEVERV